MAQLIKSYPDNPHKNRIVFSGDLETMIELLDAIEARIKREQLRIINSVFVEFSRVDKLTLNTCVYRDNDGDEESFDINYSIFS